ncbi:hypothetical protein Tco_0451760 [Tanacetum coccineum]
MGKLWEKLADWIFKSTSLGHNLVIKDDIEVILESRIKFGSAQLDYAAKSVVNGHGQYGCAPTVNPEGKVSEALGPSPTLRKRRALPDKMPKGMFRMVKSPFYSF